MNVFCYKIDGEKGLIKIYSFTLESFNYTNNIFPLCNKISKTLFLKTYFRHFIRCCEHIIFIVKGFCNGWMHCVKNQREHLNASFCYIKSFSKNKTRCLWTIEYSYLHFFFLGLVQLSCFWMELRFSLPMFSPQLNYDLQCPYGVLASNAMTARLSDYILYS